MKHLRWTFYIFALFLMLLAGCAAPAASPVVPPATLPPLTDTAVPSHTPNPFPDPVLKIVGEEQVVYDWTTDRCADLDIPDLPARAFRNAQGQVQLIAAMDTNRRSLGSSLDELKHDCNVIMGSDFQAVPSPLNDYEWLATLYQ